MRWGELRPWLNQPREVTLETLAICNAACTFCPYPGMERLGERMPDELIARLVDEMATFRVPFLFAPFKLSDPLLDKRLLPLLNTMSERTKAVPRIFTNGSGLTDAMIGGLAALPKLELSVSLNAHDPAEYEALMGLKFERTAARLDALHAGYPAKVSVTRVGAGPGFVAYCRERWPKFHAYEIKRDGWLGFTNADLAEVPDTSCARWWELSIMATGIVSHCCMDGRGEYPIGDVSKQTLLEVYNAPDWRNRRVRLMSRKAMTPCNTCSY